MADLNYLEKIKERYYRYLSLTEKALEKIKFEKNLSKEQEKIAKDFLSMAKNYKKDSEHFAQKQEWILALSSVSYAHAWLDAGVRAGLFDVGEDDFLFTLR